MKQYTTPEQTAKLIELGLPKPKTPISYSYPDQSEQQKAYEASLGLDPYLATVDQIEFEYAYSIGELIEMLPQTINVFYDLSIMSSHRGWWVLYGMIGDGGMWSIEHEVYRNDLIDALYAMILQLKEKE